MGAFFWILVVAIYLLYKYCEDIADYNKKGAILLFGKTIFYFAAIIMIAFFIGFMQQAIGPIITLVALLGILIAMFAFFLFPTRNTKVLTDEDKMRLQAQVHEEFPTEAEMNVIRDQILQETNEFLDDKHVINIWRFQRYHDLIHEFQNEKSDD